MKPADHMHLGDADFQAPLHAADDLVDGQFERVALRFAGAKGAELAPQDAVIRIIDVEIVDVGADVPVLPLANDIRDHAERVEVAALIEMQAVRIRDPLPYQHLAIDGLKVRRNEFLGNQGRACERFHKVPVPSNAFPIQRGLQRHVSFGQQRAYFSGRATKMPA